MYSYQLKLDSNGQPDQGVYRIAEDGTKSVIPFVIGNKDYQEYQEWLALGNTPEEAE